MDIVVTCLWLWDNITLFTYIWNANNRVIGDEVSSSKSPDDTWMPCFSYLNKWLQNISIVKFKTLTQSERNDIEMTGIQ